jgi:hypothetical protein
VIATPTAEPPQATTHSPDRVGALIRAEAVAQVLRCGPIGAYIVAGIAGGILLIGLLIFSFSCSCREAQLTEQSSNPPRHPLPDGIISVEVKGMISVVIETRRCEILRKFRGPML